jgi:plastocyanin
MRSLCAYQSHQLSIPIIYVPPWTSLLHRWRGRAVSRPQAMTRVHCGALHSCTNSATSHNPCSRHRLGWGSALAAGFLLTWLASVPSTMATQATPAPTQVEVATAVAMTPQITVEQATFGPATLTIPVGATVTWVNHDSDLHTVTSTQGVFASPGLDSGDTFAYRFTAPGTYPYFCALHPHMKGTIIVQ